MNDGWNSPDEDAGRMEPQRSEETRTYKSRYIGRSDGRHRRGGGNWRQASNSNDSSSQMDNTWGSGPRENKYSGRFDGRNQGQGRNGRGAGGGETYNDSSQADDSWGEVSGTPRESKPRFNRRPGPDDPCEEIEVPSNMVGKIIGIKNRITNIDSFF